MSDPDKSLVDEAFATGEMLRLEHPEAAAPEPKAAAPERKAAAPERNKLSAAGAVAQSVWAKLIIVGVNASTGILTARGLQPTGRGELAAMILWPVFLGSAMTLGVPSALIFQMRRDPARQSQLAGAALLISLLTSLVAMAVGYLFVPVWIHQYSPEVVFYARIFLLSCPLTSVVLVGRAALECDGNFTASNKLLVASPALTLVWLSGLALTHTMTPVRAAFAYVPMGIFPVIWMLYLLRRRFSPTLQGLRGAASLLFAYGLRSYGVDLCGAMALYVDQALVVRVLSPSAMGIYVVALSLSRMLNAFHTSVVMVLFPSAVSQTPEVIRDMTGRATRMSTLLTTVAGICIIAVGPQALTLLYGREYRGALVVLDVLVVEVVLSGATLVLSQAFMAMGRPGVVTLLQVTGLLLTVPLVLLLAPSLGILGAGLALLISTTTRLIFVLASFPLFLKMRVPAVIPTSADVRLMHSLIARRLHRRTS